MRALVGVKRVLDFAIKVRVNAEKTGVALKGLKMSLNPFDEIAVEEAIQMKEKGKISEVVVLTIGDKQYPYPIILTFLNHIELLSRCGRRWRWGPTRGYTSSLR